MQFDSTKPNGGPSDKETRRHLTPYAFGVSNELLGVPLAKPFRRLMAILIDLIIIGLLATINSIVLAILVVLVSSRALWKMRGKEGYWVARSVLLATILLTVLIALVSQLEIQPPSWMQGEVVTIQEQEPTAQEHAVNGSEQPVAYFYSNDNVSPEYEQDISSLITEEGEFVCAAKRVCDQSSLSYIAKDIKNLGYSFDDAAMLFEGISEYLESEDKLSDDAQGLTLTDILYENGYAGSPPESPGLIAWFESAAADFGLSFGWAALYFSVFLAWWDGQTIGKALFRIRVVKIDGSNLDLWESFGRCGGYSAGAATGLLGFLQVYWDSNRQAIQDKISETVVIDLKKMRKQGMSLKTSAYHGEQQNQSTVT